MANVNPVVYVVLVVAVIGLFVMMGSPSITGKAIDPLRESRAGAFCYDFLEKKMEQTPLSAEEQMNYVRDCVDQLLG